jgi:hypothetical protein
MTSPPPPSELPAGFDAERFFKRMGSIGHNGALGVEWEGASRDWVELRLPWRDTLIGDEEAEDEGVPPAGDARFQDRLHPSCGERSRYRRAW